MATEAIERVEFNEAAVAEQADAQGGERLKLCPWPPASSPPERKGKRNRGPDSHTGWGMKRGQVLPAEPEPPPGWSGGFAVPRKAGQAMRDPMQELFRVALGLAEPSVVSKIEFPEGRRQLVLWLDFPSGSRFAGPECGRGGFESRR